MSNRGVRKVGSSYDSARERNGISLPDYETNWSTQRRKSAIVIREFRE